MENNQVSPSLVYDALFEKVNELTRDNIIQSAYIKQLETRIKQLEESQEK
jgi:hypothetical protein